MAFDPSLLRQQFPILEQPANGYPLIYLDNAATTQKPSQVLQRLQSYYLTSNANVHRGAHFLSDLATNQFESARHTIARFIGAEDVNSIIWTKGATEAINMVAYGLEHLLSEQDEILITSLEHHANLVPWQQLAKRCGARLRVIPFTSDGLWQTEYANYFSKHTKIVACTQVSNAIGVHLPLEHILNCAKEVGAFTLVDGAQAVAHYPIDVMALDCDFYAFSGHKMYGPTGIGVLYGKQSALEQLQPYQTGGEMVLSVSFKETHFNQLPFRLEAGTPNIEGAVGLAAACDFLEQQDRPAMLAWEQGLAERTRRLLTEQVDIRVYSPSQSSTMISLSVNGVHPGDLGAYLDSKGIAVRSGRHCAHPLMAQLGIAGTLRASFACYNTLEEADRFVETLVEGIELFSDD